MYMYINCLLYMLWEEMKCGLNCHKKNSCSVVLVIASGDHKAVFAGLHATVVCFHGCGLLLGRCHRHSYNKMFTS